MTRLERIICLLRECADEVEDMPHRTNILGMRVVDPDALRSEAEWLESWNETMKKANEEKE